MATHDAYLERARGHYSSGEMRKCIVMLNHTPLTAETAGLMIEAAYQLWRQVCWFPENEPERKVAVTLVLESFERVMSSGDHSLMSAIGYVQLSHLYIFQGSTGPALNILNLASARGHLTDVVILFQSWIVLKTLGFHDQSERSMNYLIEAIALEPRQAWSKEHDALFVVGTNLNMAYIYMHCANYVRHKCTKKKHRATRTQLVEQFKAMLAEAYCIYTKKVPDEMKVMLIWFDNYDLWMKVAEDMQETPFGILMVEECYFQALLRNHLNNEPLRKLVDSMKRHKREGNLRIVLEKVISACRWNVLCRRLLVELDDEEDVPYMFGWRNKFAQEEKKFSKIQARVRGWRFRGKWVQNKENLVEIKSKYQETLEVSFAAYAAQRNKRLLQIFRLWNEVTGQQRLEKYWASITLQAWWRMTWAVYCYKWALYRVRRANHNFYVACQLSYDTKRVIIMRNWENLTSSARRTRSAGVVASFLRTTKFCNAFYPGLERVLTAIAVKRKYSNRKSWAAFRKVYETRRRRNARLDIRFFIRNNYKNGTREERMQQQALLEARLDAAEAKVSKTIRFNPVYQIRPFWKIWRFEMYKINCARARERVAVLLPRLRRRVQRRDMLRRLRLRLEGRISALVYCRARRVSDIYFFMKFQSAALKLQRFLMCACARKKLRRFKRHKKGMDVMKARRHKKMKEMVLLRWDKFMFLQRRERIRAANQIRKFSKKLKLRDKIRDKCRQHIQMVAILHGLHRMFMRYHFTRLAAATVFERKRVVLTPFFDSMSCYQLRSGFSSWLKGIHRQKLLDALVAKFVGHRLGLTFWWNCHESVHIVPSDELAMRQEDFYLLAHGKDAPSRVEFEERVAPRRMLFSEEDLPRLRAFKCLVTAYRWRHRLHRMSSRSYATAFICHQTNHSILRISMAVVIQCRIRIFQARRRFRYRLSRFRLALEHFYARYGTGVLHSFRKIQNCALRQASARNKIQMHWRRALACRKVRKLRNHKRRLEYFGEIVSSSRVQRWVARRVLAIWGHGYCLQACEHNLFHLSLNSGSSPCKDSSQFLENRLPPDHLTQGKQQLDTLISSKAVKRRRQNVKAMNDRFSKAINEIYFAPMSEAQQGNVDNNGVLVAEAHRQKINALNPFYKLTLLPDESSVNSNETESRPQKTQSYLKSKSTSSLEDEAGGSSWKVAKSTKQQIKASLVDEFQSMEFHANLFRLRQTGVFTFDSQTNLLTEGEIDFFVKNCHTLFCQGVNSLSLENITRHFSGAKLVFCGGCLNCRDIGVLLTYLEKISDPISLHFGDVHLEMKARSLFTAFLCNNKPGSVKIKELSIDTNSFGSLGVAVLLCSIRLNLSIETLLLTCKSARWPPSLGEALKVAAQSNYQLKELRLLGASLTSQMMQRLVSALGVGFHQLSRLEFCCDSTSAEAVKCSEEVIDMGRKRAFSSSERCGVSITVSHLR